MLKRFSLVLLIILTGCNQTSTIVNTIPNSTPTPLSSVVPSLILSSPSPSSTNVQPQPIIPSPSPSINQLTTVKSIFAFPNYLVLKQGETKNIYSQVKMINGISNNNFTRARYFILANI